MRTWGSSGTLISADGAEVSLDLSPQAASKANALAPIIMVFKDMVLPRNTCFLAVFILSEGLASLPLGLLRVSGARKIAGKPPIRLAGLQ